MYLFSLFQSNTTYSSPAETRLDPFGKSILIAFSEHISAVTRIVFKQFSQSVEFTVAGSLQNEESDSSDSSSVEFLRFFLSKRNEIGYV